MCMVHPRSITLIRHGEKPTDHNRDQGVNERGHARPDSLSPRGWQRAGALAALLGGKLVSAPFVRPTALYTCGYPDNPDGTKHRPHETITPLSRRLGLDIRVPVTKTEGPQLATLLLNDTGDVLVCWEHDNIPPIAAALAQALGLEELPAAAKLWPDDDFHSALIFSRSGRTWSVVQVSEDVLGGDG